MAVTIGPLAEIQRQLQGTVARDDLTPADRITKLRGLRDDLSRLLGEADTYIKDTELLREADALDLMEALLYLRENATIREELLRRGVVSEEELDEHGYISFDEIDKLKEEGRLMEFAGEVKAFIEKLHPRDRHGMFAAKPGQIHLPAKGRGGGGTPKVLHTHPPDHVKAPGVVTHEEAAHAQTAQGQFVKHGDKVGQITRVHPGGDHADVQFQDGVATVPFSELDPHVLDDLPGEASDEATWSTEKGDPATAEQLRRGLATAQRIGLNDWPDKGEVAKKLLGDAKDTFDLHTTMVGDMPVWSPERTADVHEPILDLLLRQRTTNDKGDLVPDPNGAPIVAHPDGPKILFMAGGTASGKSTALALPENKDVQPPDAVHIDPDEIKGLLPEYQQMIAGKDRYSAMGVHEESSYLAKKLYERATAQGLNVILDGTGNSGKDKFAKKIKAAKEIKNDVVTDGYHVGVFYVNAPTDLAVIRNTKRAQKTGRWVPEPEVRSIHKNVSTMFPQVKELAEGGMIDELRGYMTVGEPKLMFHTDPSSGFTVADDALYSMFLAKRHE